MSDPWEVLKRTEVLKVSDRLTVHLEHIRLPDGREAKDYVQLSMPSFTVIVAQTPDGLIICERQYKRGVRRVILTLPAGTLDTDEEPTAGAQRELLEETGYASDDWQPLPVRTMHGNAGGNLMHAFVARNCRKVAEPDSGDLEEISLEFKTPREILEAIEAGEMPLAADSVALLSGLLALKALPAV